MGTGMITMQQEHKSPNRPTPGRVGRPRAFQDDDVYRVMTNVIDEVGYAGLTFALIAAQIKCTTSALIRRFGDKRSLVQGYIMWLAGRQDEFFQQYRDKQISPLNMLRARFFIPMQPKGDVVEMFERPDLFLSFFIEARSEPAYRAQLAKLSDEVEANVRQGISDAITAGELSRCDASEVAHTLNAAMLGSISLWIDHQRTPLVKEMERVFEAVLAPYRAK